MESLQMLEYMKQTDLKKENRKLKKVLKDCLREFESGNGLEVVMLSECHHACGEDYILDFSVLIKEIKEVL